MFLSRLCTAAWAGAQIQRANQQVRADAAICFKTCVCPEIKNAWGSCSVYLSSYSALAFTGKLAIRMYSFQGKQLRRWYLLTCSHCWLFEAQLSDLWDTFALWIGSVWCGKSNIWRLIGGTSLSDMLSHISFSINWMFPPLTARSDAVGTLFQRGGLITHQIDVARVEEYLTATAI